MIGRVPFTDGAGRDVFEDAEGRQCVVDEEGASVYGVWLAPPDEAVVVEGLGP